MLLKEVAAGSRSIDEALRDLRDCRSKTNGIIWRCSIIIDSFRTGVPEVSMACIRTPAQIAAIVERMVARDGRAIVTRRVCRSGGSGAREISRSGQFETARIIVGGANSPRRSPIVLWLVVTAGTSDLPVAERPRSRWNGWARGAERVTMSAWRVCIA